MASNQKRKAGDDFDGGRAKTKKQWRVPRKNDSGADYKASIQPGDSGIWVTCVMGKEGRCVGEVKDLFNDYAESLYSSEEVQQSDRGAAAPTAADDIENEIQAEIAEVRKPAKKQFFTPIKLDVQCVLFFKTVSPVEPVAFVKRICQDAMNDSNRKRTRFTKRFSPMTLMGRASAEGLEKVAREVLAPHFHQEPIRQRKFAIRPNIRNHNVLKRDAIIKQVASLVGPEHVVDLTNYELLIMVDVYKRGHNLPTCMSMTSTDRIKNVCGVSVVDDTFEGLKRYNLSEIYEPTPKEDSQGKDTQAHKPEGHETATAAVQPDSATDAAEAV